MSEPFKVCVIGGSNSLMTRGWVPPAMQMARNRFNRAVELNNVSIGGTFSHFGIWQLLSKKPHLAADVVIVEYVLNDSELASAGVFRHWAKAYEGLLRKIRTENPRTQLICPLLVNRQMAAAQSISTLISGVMMINSRYDVETIDVNKEIAAKAPLGYWTPEKDWYIDGSHYAKPFQAMIAELVVDRIACGRGRAGQAEYLPVSNDNFAEAKSAAAEGLLQRLVPEAMAQVNYKNRLVDEKAYQVVPDMPLEFTLNGEIVALIFVSTRADGVLTYHHGSQKVNAGLHRKAFSEPKWDFLMNVFVPDQYMRSLIGTTTEPTPVRLEMLSDDAAAKLPKKSIISRPTASAPEGKTKKRAFALVDIVYVGELF